jgi:hypothetical protein
MYNVFVYIIGDVPITNNINKNIVSLLDSQHSL